MAIKIFTERCRMIACEYEASSPKQATAKAWLSEHLAQDHGIGPKSAKTHLGCPVRTCSFNASGPEGYAALLVRGHMITVHGVDPRKPELPADARRGR